MKLPREWLWVFACGVGAFFLLMGPNIENFPPVSSDEVWNLSVSYKLATESILGSDLFTGIFHADTHYFFNLPLHHFFQASVFGVVGVGIWQARLVSLLSGVILVLTVTWVTHRWFGIQTALLTASFLLFWRSNLIGLPPGIPLIAMARNGRSDLLAVTFAWLSLLALTNLTNTKRWWGGFLTGFFAGLGALTQFFGFFVVPVVGLLWVHQNRQTWCRHPATYWLALGFLIVLLPYLTFILVHYEDFLDQTLLLKAERINFGNIMFYLENLWAEPQRYAPLLTARTPGPWLILPAVTAYFLLYRPSVLPSMQQEGILFLKVSFPLFWLQLIVIDQTKAPLYSVILMPSLCILLALLVSKLMTWGLSKPRHNFTVWFQKGLVSVSLALIFVEGSMAHVRDWQAAQIVSPYQDVGKQITAHIPPGAQVAGMIRWWWAFFPEPFTTTGNQWARWRMASQANQTPDFHRIFSEDKLEYIVITKNVREYIIYQPESLETQYWHFLETCTRNIALWMDKTYGVIEIYKIEWDSSTCVGKSQL